MTEQPTSCPVCACEWRVQPLRCVCGYDFATGSTQEAIRSLAIAKRSAKVRWVGGLVLFCSTVGTLLLANMTPAMLIAMPIIVTVQVLFGLGLLTSGLARSMRVGRQLDRARTLHQLPEARLLR